MLLNLTEEQVIQLAPDASSVKAGKGLAVQNKWVLLAYSKRAIWGHCQGSGQTPYQTVIDIKNIAFRCSCPSHKFPCKHSLGLLLLYVAHADCFKESEEPDWINIWLSKREEKTEKKAQKSKDTSPLNEAAQAKRLASRHQKVLNGIEELQIWMKDLLRNGLLNIPENAHTLFDSITRRMIDAQAPGLSGRIRSLQEIDYYTESWKYILIDQLSKLYLLTESYKNLEKQSEEWQTEIRTQIGYTQSKEEVLAGESISDYWLILHKRSRQISGLNTDTFWLYGKQSEQIAIYLSFTPPGALPELNLLPGSVYKGTICFYKGVGNLRCLFKECELSQETFTPQFIPQLQEATQKYRDALQLNPFAEDIPLLVENIYLASGDKQLYLTNGNNEVLPIQMSENIRIDILSITGGKPFNAFLLGNATSWSLKNIWYESKYYMWKDEIN